MEDVGKPIKVCFISPLGYGLYRPESGYAFGGAEVQFFLLSRQLSADDSYKVFVLATVDGESGEEQHGNLTLIKRRGKGRLSICSQISRIHIGVLKKYVAAFVEMKRELRSIDADIYLHMGASVEVGAYAIICRLLGRKFVYVVASSVDLCEPNGKVAGPLKWLFPAGLRLADTVVCQTQEQLGWLRSRYQREGTLIRTGHVMPARPQKEDGKSTVLWVGRIEAVKRPELFVALAEYLPDEQLVMVIMCDTSGLDSLKQLKQRAATVFNLTMYENVPWNRIDDFFCRAKLFVNTSSYEGFPNTFVQAAMHGTPILSLSLDPDGVLAQHGIGRSANGSFERLVALSKQLCNSGDVRHKMGLLGIQYAEEQHDLNVSISKLKELICSRI